MLDDQTITTICKVKGGHSYTQLRLDIYTGIKVCVSYNFLSVDSKPLSFIDKIIVNRQSYKTTKNI